MNPALQKFNRYPNRDRNRDRLDLAPARVENAALKVYNATANAAGLSGGSLRWQLHRRFSKTESGEVNTNHHIGRLPSPKATAGCFGLGQAPM